jgi:hypothetical protein
MDPNQLPKSLSKDAQSELMRYLFAELEIADDESELYKTSSSFLDAHSARMYSRCIPQKFCFHNLLAVDLK